MKRSRESKTTRIDATLLENANWFAIGFRSCRCRQEGNDENIRSTPRMAGHSFRTAPIAVH
jgi:hypothetical protein